MPNWSYNTISVKGEKAQVIDWLNKGLKQEKCKTLLTTDMPIEKIKEICKGAELSLDSFNPMPKTFKDWDTTNDIRNYDFWLQDIIRKTKSSKKLSYIYTCLADKIKVILGKKYSLYSVGKDASLKWQLVNAFVKIASDEQQADFKKEYANYLEGYHKARKEQAEKYGFLGWYDWGLKYRGTKWDAWFDFDNCFDWEEANGILYIHLKCDTAWNLPSAWLAIQQQQWENKGLTFFIRANEEGSAYNGYGYGNGCFVEDINTYEQAVDEVGKNNDFEPGSDEFYDAVYEYKNTLDNELDNRYLDFVYQS